MSQNLHIVILAAGEGTRMKSHVPKVLHSIGGRPMITHLLDTAAQLEPAAVHVVIGSGADDVRAACQDRQVNWVLQAERKGTGHAVMQAMPEIPEDAVVMVLLGDHPLIPVSLLQELKSHSAAPLAILTMELEEPKGYGRVERDRRGRISNIVEDKDATPEQLAIREVNSGIIMAQASELRRWLNRLGCDNRNQEYYLTDIFAMAHSEDKEIHNVLAPDSRDLQGANDRRQLAFLERRYRHHAAVKLMKMGVQLIDPERVDIRGEVEAGSDVIIDINVVLEGSIRLGDGVTLGPGSVLRDCDLAAGTTVHAHSVLEGIRTTGACDIGPFARVRPGTVLAEGTRVGNFVEVKNSKLGQGSKASHLSYVGDTQVGERVNIGAGTITCNYDGVNKHATQIGNDAFIGSGTELVAPVSIGAGATIGAGTTLSKDAPAGELTVSRTRQTTIKGWKRPRKKAARDETEGEG
jgi:bifunctional UDP-N-acetylglucosamine pyrophosphorylase/glucosamine-1-phosphate N-acetyltransferase